MQICFAANVATVAQYGWPRRLMLRFCYEWLPDRRIDLNANRAGSIQPCFWCFKCSMLPARLGRRWLQPLIVVAGDMDHAQRQGFKMSPVDHNMELIHAGPRKLHAHQVDRDQK